MQYYIRPLKESAMWNGPLFPPWRDSMGTVGTEQLSISCMLLEHGNKAGYSVPRHPSRQQASSTATPRPPHFEQTTLK